MGRQKKLIEPIDASFDEVSEILTNPPDAPQMPLATHQGQMAIGELLLDCYVLEDGRRVFHKRGMAKALGMKSGGGNVFLRAMKRKSLGSNIPDNLMDSIEKPISFKPLTSDLAHGYEATILSDIAKAIVAAKAAGNLTKSQESLYIHAMILNNSFSKVGAVALVDEATGYQQVRDPSALRILVQQYIAEEKSEWRKEFPDRFFDQLNKMYGSQKMTVNRVGTVIQNRPQHFAKFIRKYIYEPMANGEVLKELDKLNPIINSKGTRKDRLHQHLSEEYGKEKLRIRVQEVMTLVSVSDNIDQFKKLYRKRYPKKRSDQFDFFDELQ